VKLNALAISLALAAAATSASALTVVSGNVPQIDSNLVRNPCSLADSTATGGTVFGCLNDNHAQLVRLMSDESLVITGGQASLDAADETFSRLTVSLEGAALGTLILDIDSTVNGFIRFTDGSGATSGLLALDGNGQNFFTLTGISGGSASFVTYLAGQVETDLVADVKQIRLGVVGAVPEPETYALMLAGLGVMGFIARRRKVA
jgi:hypothetical protein